MPIGRRRPTTLLVMRTEAEDDDDDSPRLARLLVWKVAEATEPGLLIGAAELSSETLRIF